MTRQDAQRAEDARQAREKKEGAARLLRERIAKHWANGTTSPAAIGVLVGCSHHHVSDVLAEFGLRTKRERKNNRRPTTGAIIRKAKTR